MSQIIKTKQCIPTRQELQRQMVEAERWRAETKKMAALLKRARDDLERKAGEMATLRAQNITWSADNRQKRTEAGATFV